MGLKARNRGDGRGDVGGEFGHPNVEVHAALPDLLAVTFHTPERAVHLGSPVGQTRTSRRIIFAGGLD
jgi:hypothetical protein